MIDESELYKRMLLVRLLEEKLQELCLTGEASDLHFSKGQEAISVGACAALKSTDYMVTHHRTIAHSIARGVPLKPLVAEILGKATGFNKGMAGEMHIRYPPLRYMFSFQLVGTCFRPNTLILGDNQPISGLHEGGRCFGNGKTNVISRTFNRQYRGSMLKVKAAGLLPFEATPEHPCLVVSCTNKSYRNETGKYWGHKQVFLPMAWKPITELRVKNREHPSGDYLLLPRLKGASSVQELDLNRFINGHFHKNTEYDFVIKLRRNGLSYPSIQRAVMARFKHDIALNLLHGWVNGKWRPRKRLTRLPVGENVAWLFGVYVAEGCYDGRQGPTFALHIKERSMANRILNIGRRLGCKGIALRQKNSNGQHVKLYSNSLGRAFELFCGKRARNKQIPEFLLLHRDLGLLESFLLGYCQGDGHSRNGVTSLVTVSKLLALQLQLAYARLGVFAALSVRKQRIDSRGTKHQTCYRLRVRRNGRVKAVKVTDDHIYVPVRSVTKSHYEGQVHNIETTDNTYLVSNVVVHNCVPVAAGLAWAVKNFLKEDSIVAVFFGDAATGNAQTHEGLNIASVRKAPLLLICENNGLAGNVKKEYYLPTETVAERAASYGIQATRIDGNRLDVVVETVTRSTKLVRDRSEPYLVEMDTTRLSWHKQGQPDSRSKEEVAELAKRDPLLYEEKRLNISSDQKKRLVDEITKEIQDAVEAARSAPLPQFKIV